jgi:hypothetical protein
MRLLSSSTMMTMRRLSPSCRRRPASAIRCANAKSTFSTTATITAIVVLFTSNDRRSNSARICVRYQTKQKTKNTKTRVKLHTERRANGRRESVPAGRRLDRGASRPGGASRRATHMCPHPARRELRIFGSRRSFSCRSYHVVRGTNIDVSLALLLNLVADRLDELWRQRRLIRFECT